MTHNPELSRYSTRNIFLRDGRVMEDSFNSDVADAAAMLASLPIED